MDRGLMGDAGEIDVSESVRQFLASGGIIRREDGFSEIAPRPEHRPAPKRKRRHRKNVQNVMPDGTVTRSWISDAVGFTCATMLGQPLYVALLPKPLAAKSPTGALLYDRNEADKAVDKILDKRASFNRGVTENE